MPVQPGLLVLVGSVFVIGYFAAFVVRAHRLGKEEPELATGYRRLATAIFAVVALSFVVSLPAVVSQLRPHSIAELHGSVFSEHTISAYDVALVAIQAALAIALTWWLFARGGVDYIVAHRRLFGRFVTSRADVMMLWGVLLLASFVGMVARIVEIVRK